MAPSLSALATDAGQNPLLIRLQGLINSNSTLGAGEQLTMHLENERPSAICLVFGHVDLHINYLW